VSKEWQSIEGGRLQATPAGTSDGGYILPQQVAESCG